MIEEPKSSSSPTSSASSRLEELLLEATEILKERNSEECLTKPEIKASLATYKELRNVLSLPTRTGDWSSVPSTLNRITPFHETYTDMVKEFDEAADMQAQLLQSHPAAVRPVALDTLSQVNEDFFILDNSLRETTVGAPRGHTLEEKHQIVHCIADSGLEEVILGAYGSKISVDSQIAERWREMNKSFDSTWGFSSLYDFEDFDQEVVWNDLDRFYDATKTGKVTLLDGNIGDNGNSAIQYYCPPSKVKCTYSEAEITLFKRAFRNFQPGAFPPGKTPDQILKESESELGRIPMGLLMICGYGIKNAILELDSSLETFDYDSFNLLDRCKFLMQWTKDNLERRHKTDDGLEGDPRVLFNFTDFANWKRSSSGLEEALCVIHELSSLPKRERPFGFMMEDPSAWLFPDEIGRLIRMMRLTMSRAGFSNGKLLVHIHMHFGTAEANVLSTLVNGADGVWAAMCSTGAQTGHACSTVTAVNLFRAGLTEVADKYNLEKMALAAREIHAISTREKCPLHQEVYGEDAFDVPFIMTAVPYCRYALVMLLQKMGIQERGIRLNEIVPVSAVRRAMVQHFGEAERSGWDPKYCPAMHTAIHDHLLTGLSRDYNTAAGLGQLYSLVSQKQLSPRMVWTMMTDSDIPDYHPTILEFIARWNRLCAKYIGEKKTLPGSEANSCMCFNVDVTVEPELLELPFSFFFRDVMENHVLVPLPKMFKSYMHKLVVDEEKRLQGTRNPTVNFFDQIVRLKLFIEEAESLMVMPLVDDFVLRKNHDFFFGEDHDWLREVRGSRPKVIKQILRAHMDFYPRFYKHHGNHGMLRCLKASAKRIAENQGIIDDLQDLRSGDSKQAIENVAFEQNQVVNIAQTRKAKKGLNVSNQSIDVISDEFMLTQLRQSLTKRYSNPSRRSSEFLLSIAGSRGSGHSSGFSGPGRTSDLFHMIDNNDNDDEPDAFLITMDEIMKDLKEEDIRDLVGEEEAGENITAAIVLEKKKDKGSVKDWVKNRVGRRRKKRAQDKEQQGLKQ